jgi:hypothetical protein
LIALVSGGINHCYSHLGVLLKVLASLQRKEISENHVLVVQNLHRAFGCDIGDAFPCRGGYPSHLARKELLHILGDAYHKNLRTCMNDFVSISPEFTFCGSGG